MSLIAWYKLDGNVLDSSGNGRDGATVGTPNVGAGKIGSSYSFDYSSDDGISIPNNNFPLYDFTMTAWIKPVGDHYHYDGTIISSGDWNGSHWSFGVNQGNTGVSCRNPYFSAAYAFTLNTWHFVVYRREGTNLKLYVNNTLLYAGTVTTHIPLSSNATNTCIGRETYAGGYFGFNGSIDDVRIYDHALSEKEIKELAKAKVLHYTFDEFQEPTINLITGKTIATTHSKSYPGGVANGWETTGIANDNPRVILTTASTSLSPSTVYTFSAIYWHSQNIVDDVYLQFTGTGYPEAGVYFQPFTDQTASLGGYYSIKDLGNGWKYCSGTFTTTANTTALNAIFFDNDTAGYVCFLGNMQLEQKDHATPFVNGIRTGSVSDNSGYGNNAVLASATTPQWTEDSRIGKGAYKFDESFMTFPPISLSRNNGWTFSCWFKLGTTRNTLISNSDFERFDISSTGFVIWVWNYNGQNLQTNTANPVASGTDWHLLTLVFDLSESRINIFADGVYKEYFLYSPSNTPEALVFDKVGATFTNVGGYIDDYRIYATALSADDVKELYNTRAQIDDRGNFFLHNINQAGGLVGWWPLSGDTKDYSGFGNDGINNGAVSTTGVLGEADTAYQFTESTDYISLPADTSLVKSISFWLKEDIIDHWLPFTGQSNSHYLMATSGGVGAFYHGNSGTPIIFRDSQETLYPAGDTSWHHYVATNIDISLWTEIRLSGYRTTNWPLEGKVSDVRFYNRILSSEEIEALYNMTEPLPAAMRLHDNGIADFIDISEIGPAKGLVAYYPLNGNAKDYAGYNDGTVVGATIAAGINGKACYSFDGVDDKIESSNSEALNQTESFSLSIWIKPFSFPSFSTILAKGRSSSWFQTNYVLGLNNNKIRFKGTFSNNIELDSQTALIENSWYNIICTYDNDLKASRIFINSIKDNNESLNGKTPTSVNEPLFIGVQGELYSPFNGLIQNVRIYNRALSPEEISILYDLEKGDTVKVKMDKNTLYIGGQIYEG